MQVMLAVDPLLVRVACIDRISHTRDGETRGLWVIIYEKKQSALSVRTNKFSATAGLMPYYHITPLPRCPVALLPCYPSPALVAAGCKTPGRPRTRDMGMRRQCPSKRGERGFCGEEWCDVKGHSASLCQSSHFQPTQLPILACLGTLVPRQIPSWGTDIENITRSPTPTGSCAPFEQTGGWTDGLSAVSMGRRTIASLLSLRPPPAAPSVYFPEIADEPRRSKRPISPPISP